MRAIFLAFTAIVLCGPFSAAQPQTPIRVGDFTTVGENGITLCKDPLAAVAFQLPKGWVLQSGYRWGDHETTLLLREVSSGLTASMYYQYPLQTTRSSDPDIAFRGFMTSKVRQRRDRDGLTGYHIREGSVQRRTVADRPALSFLADFTRPDGEAGNEYMLELVGASIKLLCFFTEPASVDSSAFAKRLDAVAESLKIPEYPTMNLPVLTMSPPKP